MQAAALDLVSVE